MKVMCEVKFFPICVITQSKTWAKSKEVDEEGETVLLCLPDFSLLVSHSELQSDL